MKKIANCAIISTITHLSMHSKQSVAVRENFLHFPGIVLIYYILVCVLSFVASYHNILPCK